MRAPALRLQAIQAWDRLHLRILQRAHPGLQIHSGASSNLAVARYNLAPDAVLRIGDGVATERLPGRLHFVLYPAARVEIGARAWLRVEVGEVYVVAYPGARLRIGDEGFLNGAHLSAKQELTLGRRVWVGPGSRIFDSDQHDLDADRPERPAAVRIGDHCWIAGDVTVLKGVTIGEHSVVGTHSLVTGDLPAHTLAYGRPAKPRGRVGDRSRAR